VLQAAAVVIKPNDLTPGIIVSDPVPLLMLNPKTPQSLGQFEA